MASLMSKSGVAVKGEGAKTLDPDDMDATTRAIIRLLYDNGWTSRQVGRLFNRNHMWALRRVWGASHASAVYPIDDDRRSLSRKAPAESCAA